MERKRTRIFIDMDGCLARFYESPSWKKEFRTAGFFRNLRHYENMEEAVKLLRERHDCIVYILTAVEAAWVEEEKEAWIAEHFKDASAPFGMLFTRVGESKAKFVQDFYECELDESFVLVDDYSSNLVDWKNAGGVAVKFRNEFNACGINGTNFKGPWVSESWDSFEIYRNICRAAGLPVEAKKEPQTLHVMVGLPGSGKSTLAEALAEVVGKDAVLISSDSVRQEILGDVEDQSDQARVFATVNERITSALAEGKDVLYDATNLYKKSRRCILDSIPESCRDNIVVNFWVMNTPLDECLRRNYSRTRRVPEGVIRHMAKNATFPKRDEWEGMCVVTQVNQ